jgi:hypothetical protein
MRYFSHAFTTYNSTAVTIPLRDWAPKSVARVIIELLEINNTYQEHIENMLIGSRSSREYLKGLLAPSDFRMINDLRLWCAGVARRSTPYSGTPEIYMLCNLNTGAAHAILVDWKMNL